MLVLFCVFVKQNRISKYLEFQYNNSKTIFYVLEFKCNTHFHNKKLKCYSNKVSYCGDSNCYFPSVILGVRALPTRQPLQTAPSFCYSDVFPMTSTSPPLCLRPLLSRRPFVMGWKLSQWDTLWLLTARSLERPSRTQLAASLPELHFNLFTR